MPPFRYAECPLRGAELWLFCRSEAARLSELRADRNIAHGELTAAPVSLDAPVAEEKRSTVAWRIPETHIKVPPQTPYAPVA